LEEDKELVKPRLKLNYIGRNGPKRNRWKKLGLFVYDSLKFASLDLHKKVNVVDRNIREKERGRERVREEKICGIPLVSES